MELIFAAAICSVLVSVILKLCRDRGFNPAQMITWNYASASILCFLWFKPDLAHISINKTPWVLIAALGVLLPTIFYCLARSLQTAGILKTELAQRLSVVLSLSAAYFIFSEYFNAIKLIGIALGVLAVLLILFSQRKGSIDGKQGILFLLSVWAGYALIDVLLKFASGLGMQFAVTLNLVFICAFLLSSIYNIVQHGSLGQTKNILAGLGLGLLNFANIALYVKAHMLLKDTPAIVFAGMNILVVVLGVVAGLIIFKEKLRVATVFGLIAGIMSVVCLAYAMSV
ncbi:DMT family transporter [Acinetobacter sp. ANC 5579]|uniref:EamA family transporter n=1 Tax=Acinetobacter TaxID=469 RepID=UPI00099479EC|nr:MULTISPECIES: EamA family transporter [Acinetobacter]MCL6233984.1 DMT family transporter [Acinetobacter amyesii]MCL6243494.1 DMT family transporter [Acinetobacter amyesii]OOV81519.1 EamA family transporter [Acinetobacter sp. ANC 5600]UUS56231.1 DMT family transporter [Acinetobacter sp. YH16040_T]UUS63958.1 DMT family transporter [Acinetobacter sp. YH12068_T]